MDASVVWRLDSNDIAGVEASAELLKVRFGRLKDRLQQERWSRGFIRCVSRGRRLKARLQPDRSHSRTL